MTATPAPPQRPHTEPKKIGLVEYPRAIPPASGEYEWVYLWERPLRVMHWLAALSLMTLVVTGLFIGRPYFVPSGDPESAFLMGWMRFIHFVAATVFVMTAIVRVYWLFMGNRFERWPALFPLRRRDLRNLVKVVKFYLMIHPERAPHYLGHNPLQQFAYTGIYLSAALSVITGFAMYGQADPGGFFYVTFNWVNTLLGGQPIVRFLHHVLTWVFLIFIPIHVYLALRADTVERTGTISSIISGGRFIPKHEEFVDDDR
jgi:Ni/Fe-hydrogenase 1 B-type cytochrome subunit